MEQQPVQPKPTASGKAPRTARGERTMRKILDAALAEFGEKGFSESSIVSITARADVALGTVYAAHDPQLDRQVALKVMRDASGEEEDRVRMLREGQAMARVTHPNVITVYEVGTENGIRQRNFADFLILQIANLYGRHNLTPY